MLRPHAKANEACNLALHIGNAGNDPQNKRRPDPPDPALNDRRKNEVLRLDLYELGCPGREKAPLPYLIQIGTGQLSLPQLA